MRIIQADPVYRPITIVLETEDDYDKLMAIIEAVASNRIHHVPQDIAAAKEMQRNFRRVIDGEVIDD